MTQAPTLTGAKPATETPRTSSNRQAAKARPRRPLLPIEEEHQRDTFRSERSPLDLETEAIEFESTHTPNGWTTRG